MSVIENLKGKFDQVQAADAGGILNTIRQKAFADLSQMGIPTVKHEEWKYTRISSLFNRDYNFTADIDSIRETELNALRLPGDEKANTLVFVNGKFSKPLSKIISPSLVVMPLETAAGNEYAEIVSKNFGHSSQYLRDGINALNTALVEGAVFVQAKKGKILEHPVYIYNITDARLNNVFSQPRSLVHI